jgi:NAD(P)-dependent dehydrogenase (short-subunit alcohol dehydrogenase family)
MALTTNTEATLAPLERFSLRDKVVVLTGASSGLGERFARVVDALGATSVLAARRKDRLDALVAELGHAEAVALDVGEEGANEELIQGVLDRHGRVDVVIANAGISNPVPAAKEQVSDYRRVVEIDLVGTVRPGPGRAAGHAGPAVGFGRDGGVGGRAAELVAGPPGQLRGGQGRPDRTHP